MQHHFKYAAGYLTLDDENLYLTKSPTWEGTASLPEKNTASQEANKRRIKTNTIIFTVLFVVTALAIMLAVAKNALKFWSLLLVYFGLYKVSQLLKRELGTRYKIPLDKIESIQEYENGLKITFRNADNQPDHEIVAKVDPAGIAMLTQLKEDRVDVGVE